MAPHDISFADATRAWTRIGLNSFGGPAAQIAVTHKVIVEELKWVGERRFLGALNYCMLLPGPEAHQLVTYLGWVLHGWRGGLVAGGLFVLPGFVALMLLSIGYAWGRDLPLVMAAFYGIKAAVLAIVFEAVTKIAGRALKDRAAWVLATLAFIAIAAFAVPFPLLIVAAGVFGALRPPPAGTLASEADDAVIDRIFATGIPERLQPNLGRTTRAAVLCGTLWLAPVFGLWLTRGPDDVFTTIATFFSQTAMVTFGGAYSVLAYVAQEAVARHGWLTPAEMIDGLALAETTPGPLIQVVQFVGFIAAWRDPGTLPPLTAGILGGTLTCWVTFAPSFLWIFVGAPWIEHFRANLRLQGALRGITAAVLGVVANLAVWSSLHVLFAEVHPYGTLIRFPTPVLTTFHLGAGVIAAVATVGTLRWKWPMWVTLGGGAAAGLLGTLAVSGS